jgi:hypothetical protein
MQNEEKLCVENVLSEITYENNRMSLKFYSKTN